MSLKKTKNSFRVITGSAGNSSFFSNNQKDGSSKLSKHRRNQKFNNVVEISSAKEVGIQRLNRVSIIPRNTKQEEYVEYLDDDQKRIVFAMGPAGTGKTLLATMQAVKMYKEGKINRIIISRPAVTAEEEHGFLPGDLVAKMDPWTRPLMDVFEMYYSPKDIKTMIEEKVIEIAPLAYLRGRTFKDACIILDESQNCTVSQMKMVLTRMGEGSRMFVTGDLKQTDLRKINGLADFLEKLKLAQNKMISVVEFDKRHIERDPVVQAVLDIYGDE